MFSLSSLFNTFDKCSLAGEIRNNLSKRFWNPVIQMVLLSFCDWKYCVPYDPASFGSISQKHWFLPRNCRVIRHTFIPTKWMNGILLPKLFWPTVRKKCSSDRGKTFEIQGWRLRICNNFEINRTIFSNCERSEEFLVTECFF